ncbi:MAG: hypothetical protein HY376_01970 [Candidatus Blackburnbacteria bacterium]|nr:hypothetical protein [Candidatus Blackburnbacteria bacterium]
MTERELDIKEDHSAVMAVEAMGNGQYVRIVEVPDEVLEATEDLTELDLSPYRIVESFEVALVKME